MQWSKVKARMENRFAPSIRGVIEIWRTRYRRVHDEPGEVWITADKQRIATMGDLAYEVFLGAEERRLQKARGCTDWRNPTQSAGYYRAYWDAVQKAQDSGKFSSWNAVKAFEEYQILSLPAILKSKNPIIRAFGMLDQRFGRRQWSAFNIASEHPLVQLLYRIRVDKEAKIQGEDA